MVWLASSGSGVQREAVNLGGDKDRDLSSRYLARIGRYSFNLLVIVLMLLPEE